MKEESNNILTGNILAIVGGALLAIGLFMPWVQLGIISATAFMKAPDYAYALLVAGGISFLFALIGVTSKRNFGLVYLVVGLASGVLLFYLHYLLSDNLAGKQILGKSAQIGVGFWLCCAGAAVLFISTFFCIGKKQEKAKGTIS